jgi:cysteine desulfurase
MIYLDGHSTTPLLPEVFEAMKPYFLDCFGNASQGLHRFNWEARAGVDRAREQLASALGVRDREIIFTSGATEANHLALLGAWPALQAAGKKRVLSIRIEHASVLGALELMQERGCRVEWIRTDASGRVDFDHLRVLLGEDVGLVSVALANHEIGTLQDLKRISDLARGYGAWVHTDAVQAFGKLGFTADSIGADLITLSAHKIRGPKGVGALYVRRKNPRIELEPLYLGGGQERGLRPGTPDTPAIVGFGSAVESAFRSFDRDVERVRTLRDRLWAHLSGAIEGWVRNSPPDGLPNNLNLSIRGVDGAALFGRLKQVAVSNASACLNGIQDYSQVLTELGVERDLARATLRIGVGTWNTEAEIDLAAEEIVQVVRELRAMELRFAEQTGIFSMNGEKL